MTDPTPLSPAAQAVLNAANNAYWLWDQMCPADADVIAAAALRAAALACKRDSAILLSLADELES